MIFCTGFDDPEKAKAISKIGRSFIEETNTMPFPIFKTIVKSTREIEKYEVYCAFNPVSADSWVKKDLLDNPLFMDSGVSIHSTCEDNPFLPESVKNFYRSLTGIERTVDYDGEFGSVTSDLVFGDKLRRIKEVPKDARFINYGLDFSNGGADPHSLVAIYHRNLDLIIQPIYEGGVDVITINNKGVRVISDKPTDLASIIYKNCPYAGREMFYGVGRVMCDRANPANIKLLRNARINAKGYEGQHTRKAGIKWLNSFKRILIVDTMPSATEQWYNYRWKKDRLSGEIIAGEMDDECTHHNIDAAVYAGKTSSGYHTF